MANVSKKSTAASGSASIERKLNILVKRDRFGNYIVRPESNVVMAKMTHIAKQYGEEDGTLFFQFSQDWDAFCEHYVKPSRKKEIEDSGLGRIYMYFSDYVEYLSNTTLIEDLSDLLDVPKEIIEKNIDEYTVIKADDEVSVNHFAKEVLREHLFMSPEGDKTLDALCKRGIIDIPMLVSYLCEPDDGNWYILENPKRYVVHSPR